MTVLRILLAAGTVTLLAACEPPENAPPNVPPAKGKARVAFAQRQIDLASGSGAEVRPRQCLYVHYTGWLTDGTKFDSSRDTTASGQRRTPIVFPQGARRVIVGWDVGFEGMQVGARRRLFIPYQLAYGESGRPPIIPPKSELIFDVELMAVADTLPRAPDLEAARSGRSPSPPQCPAWEDVSQQPS